MLKNKNFTKNSRHKLEIELKPAKTQVLQFRCIVQNLLNIGAILSDSLRRPAVEQKDLKQKIWKTRYI